MSIVLPAINAATPYNDKVVSGDVMQVQYGVQFTPTPGWGITSGVRVGDAPAGGGYPALASVTTGSIVFTVQVDKYTGTAGKLLNKIRNTSDRLKTDSGLHVNGPSHTGTTSSGLTGAIARYTGTKSEGIVAAFVSAGVGIEVTAVGGPADFTDQMIRDIAGMIDSIRVVPGVRSDHDNQR